jgi:hypothetical protein
MHEAAYEPVTVTIGGQERMLRLTLRSIRLLRDKLGATGMLELQDAATQDAGDPFAQLDKVGVILWALIGDPGLTVEQVEGMVEMRELDGITEAIGRVFETDTEPQPAGKVKAPRRRAST